MGAHHYHLVLIPRASADTDPDAENLWAQQPTDTLLAELRTLLPKETSWGGVEEFESEREWGSDLRIWHERDRDGPIAAIEFRFSPTADDQAVLARFLELAAMHDLLVHSRANRRTLEPQLDEVTRDLQLTPAFQFSSDPEGAVVAAAANVRPPKSK